MGRKLFCEISPLTYNISVKKERFIRRINNLLAATKFAKIKSEPLPVVIYKHESLIHRRLGNVDMELQNNKAVNLRIAAPKVNQILIRGTIDKSTTSTLINTFTVTGKNTDPDLSNNTAVSETPVIYKICTVKFYIENCFVESRPVPCGTPVTAPSAPFKCFYKFKGWFTSDRGKTKWNFNDPVTGDIKLFARWA